MQDLPKQGSKTSGTILPDSSACSAAGERPVADPLCYGSDVIRRIVPILILACCLLPTSAQTSSGLYIGELPVENQFEQAVPVAAVLNQVLVRLTGRVGQNLVSELQLSNDLIEQMILTRQFSRVSVPDPEGRFIDVRMQRIEFDQQAVNQLLDRAGLARWGQERPQMLIWVTTDQAGSAEYLEQDSITEHALERAAFRYGLNLIRPILDAGDRIEVSPSDIRGGFTDAAENAKQRYGASGTIMLDLRQNPDFVTGRWSWKLDEMERAFERSGGDPAEVIDLGLGRIAAALSNRYAVLAGRPGQQRLVISGLSNEVQYAEITRYLNTLTGVESLRVNRAGPDFIEFELIASGSGLESRIALSDLLLFERSDPVTRALHYRLAW